MEIVRIVVDTNVFISALRSRKGAAFKLLSLLGQTEQFQICVSVPLILEYEGVAKRHEAVTGLSPEDIDDIVDYICSVASRRLIFFLWRPFLKDPKDDMLLELAVESGCRYIVSYNKKDFAGAETFNLEVLTPQEFLRKMGVLP